LAADDIAAQYAILELDQNATAEEVRGAYLDLVKVWHPDRYQHESPRLRLRAEEKLKAINRAYDLIRFGRVDAEVKPTSSASPLSVLLYPRDFGTAWGFVNVEGKLAIPPRFEAAAPFSDGLARIREKRMWGYVNLRGEYIIAPQFVDAHDYSEGLAAVVFREKWGYIDKAGRYVINALYEEAGIFSSGLAAVLWNGRWGYLDRTGTFVINPRFDGAQPFQNGWADVRVGTRWGRTNRLGEVFFDDSAELG
jgi:hypothetical protein